MKNELSNSTSPGHCANIVLYDVAPSPNSSTDAKALDFAGSACAAFALVRLVGTIPIRKHAPQCLFLLKQQICQPDSL